MDDFKIESGKFYRRRDGEIVGPIVHTGSLRYGFCVQGTSQSYTEKGEWFIDVEHPMDLISEVDLIEESSSIGESSSEENGDINWNHVRVQLTAAAIHTGRFHNARDAVIYADHAIKYMKETSL